MSPRLRRDGPAPLPDPTTASDTTTKQTQDSILVAPTQAVAIQPDNATVTVSLCNTTTSSNVYAYITGLAPNDNAVCLLQADGQTLYLPPEPAQDLTPLTVDCAIPLGAPGTTVNATVPYIIGGRVWFCIGGKLTFYLNTSKTGAALVEPSVNNTTDPNYNLTWDFIEFTYTSAEIYANVTYVDFVSLPISLTLTGSSGTVTSVGGMPATGMATVASELVAQNAIDGAGWDKLVVNDSSGNMLRVLSPLNGMISTPGLFETYYDDYVNQVWQYYISNDITINTQDTSFAINGVDLTTGLVTGWTNPSRTMIYFPTVGAQGFAKPSTYDIFSAASGAFAEQTTNKDLMLNIGARLDAAFNRSTLLINTNQPANEEVSTYYQNPVTNHYARVVHETAKDGRGYAFPYDDVSPDGEDQSGFVSDPDPLVLLVNVGGGAATTRTKRRAKRSLPMPVLHQKRAMSWMEDIKTPAEVEVEEEKDLEMGLSEKLQNEISWDGAPKFKIPPMIERLGGRFLTKFMATPLFTQKILPILLVLRTLLISLLSLSWRAILQRVFVLVVLFVFYISNIKPRESIEELETQMRMIEATGLLNGTLFSSS